MNEKTNIIGRFKPLPLLPSNCIMGPDDTIVCADITEPDNSTAEKSSVVHGHIEMPNGDIITFQADYEDDLEVVWEDLDVAMHASIGKYEMMLHEREE